MKTQEEIEQLAEQYWDKQPYNEDAYVVGYMQCQQDMTDKKYTEEDIRKALFKGFDYCLDNMTEDSSEITQDNAQDFINSLNK